MYTLVIIMCQIMGPIVTERPSLHRQGPNICNHYLFLCLKKYISDISHKTINVCTQYIMKLFFFLNIYLVYQYSFVLRFDRHFKFNLFREYYSFFSQINGFCLIFSENTSPFFLDQWIKFNLFRDYYSIFSEINGFSLIFSANTSPFFLDQWIKFNLFREYFSVFPRSMD